MDPRQRLDDDSTTLDIHNRGKQAQIQTATPGIIQSFDAAKMTCTVQPSIQGVLSDPKTGAASSTNLPILVDCPVIFPSGGGCTLTFPLAEGDECLVIFASRCIDAWWQQGGIQPPMVYRMHDLSDGFVLAGVRSQPHVLPGISTTSTQLRSDDGSTFVDVNAATQALTLTAPGGLVINADTTITGDLMNNGKSVGSTHKHSGVQSGSSNSGAPT